MTMTQRETKPKGWKSPFRVELYQVIVERTDGRGHQAVGPALLHDHAAAFCDAIKTQIKAGHERDWSNPTLLQVKAAQAQLIT